MDFADLANCFPPGISVPPELELLCKWEKENGYPISGTFKLRATHYNDLRYWFGHVRVNSRFGVFGAGSDGTMYCVWKQDDGKDRIVFLESEGDRGVLATDFRDFLRLLAVGYDELFVCDLSNPPPSKYINPKFQKWVVETFQVAVPKVGIEITKPAKDSSQNIDEWINSFK